MCVSERRAGGRVTSREPGAIKGMLEVRRRLHVLCRHEGAIDENSILAPLFRGLKHNLHDRQDKTDGMACTHPTC